MIAGPRTEEQWDDYLRALDYRFTAEDEALIDRLVAAAIPRRRASTIRPIRSRGDGRGRGDVMNATAHHDRYGLPLSTSSAEAASAYCEGVDLMFSAWTGAAEAFERAIAHDPDFALAYVARARIHTFYQQGDVARAKAATARGRSPAAASATCANARMSRRWRSRSKDGATRHSLQCSIISKEWPRDAVVLSLPLGAFGLFAFSGMADHDRARQDLCERYAVHYGDDWWFLSSYGWAMTENGQVAKGRAMTERAFAMRRENAHAAHALLHALFEDGSVDDADALVKRMERP